MNPFGLGDPIHLQIGHAITQKSEQISYTVVGRENKKIRYSMPTKDINNEDKNIIIFQHNLQQY